MRPVGVLAVTLLCRVQSSPQRTHEPGAPASRLGMLHLCCRVEQHTIAVLLTAHCLQDPLHEMLNSGSRWWYNGVLVLPAGSLSGSYAGPAVLLLSCGWAGCAEIGARLSAAVCLRRCKWAWQSCGNSGCVASARAVSARPCSRVLCCVVKQLVSGRFASLAVAGCLRWY